MRYSLYYIFEVKLQEACEFSMLTYCYSKGLVKDFEFTGVDASRLVNAFQ